MKLAPFDVGVIHPSSHNGADTDKHRHKSLGSHSSPHPQWEAGLFISIWSIKPLKPKSTRQRKKHILLRALRFMTWNFKRGSCAAFHFSASKTPASKNRMSQRTQRSSTQWDRAQLLLPQHYSMWRANRSKGLSAKANRGSFNTQVDERSHTQLLLKSFLCTLHSHR